VKTFQHFHEGNEYKAFALGFVQKVSAPSGRLTQPARDEGVEAACLSADFCPACQKVSRSGGLEIGRFC
jgi:hypothetical protein